MRWDDPNRPERHDLPRADEPRMYGPENSGDGSDGYWVRCRRPRIAGFYDHVSPERADRMESMVREFDRPMDDGAY